MACPRSEVGGRSIDDVMTPDLDLPPIDLDLPSKAPAESLCKHLGNMRVDRCHPTIGPLSSDGASFDVDAPDQLIICYQELHDTAQLACGSPRADDLVTNSPREDEGPLTGLEHQLEGMQLQSTSGESPVQSRAARLAKQRQERSLRRQSGSASDPILTMEQSPGAVTRAGSAPSVSDSVLARLGFPTITGTGNGGSGGESRGQSPSGAQAVPMDPPAGITPSAVVTEPEPQIAGLPDSFRMSPHGIVSGAGSPSGSRAPTQPSPAATQPEGDAPEAPPSSSQHEDVAASDSAPEPDVRRETQPAPSFSSGSIGRSAARGTSRPPPPALSAPSGLPKRGHRSPAREPPRSVLRASPPPAAAPPPPFTILPAFLKPDRAAAWSNEPLRGDGGEGDSDEDDEELAEYDDQVGNNLSPAPAPRFPRLVMMRSLRVARSLVN